MILFSHSNSGTYYLSSEESSNACCTTSPWPVLDRKLNDILSYGDTSDVFFPVNINQHHWVSFRVLGGRSCGGGRLTCRDPGVRFHHAAKIEKLMDNLIHRLKRICNGTWSMRIKDCEQQIDGVSCGVHVLFHSRKNYNEVATISCRKSLGQQCLQNIKPSIKSSMRSLRKTNKNQSQQSGQKTEKKVS